MQLSVGQNKVIEVNSTNSINVVYTDISGLSYLAFVKSPLNKSNVVCAEQSSIKGLVLSKQLNTFTINLSDLQADERVVIAAYIEDNQNINFSQIKSPSLIFSSKKDDISYSLNNDQKNEKALILAEIYQHNENWKVKALAGGFMGGIQDLLDYMNASMLSNQPQITQETENNTSINQETFKTEQTINNQFNSKGIKKMFKGLFKRGEQAASDLKQGVLKFKNKNFLRASIAGGFMVAAADGSIDPEEKKKLKAFIEHDESLSVFDGGDIVEIFNEFSNHYDFDVDMGKAQALKTISKISGNEEQSKFLIRMIVAIGASDGDFDEDEKTVVRTICAELGLNPAQFEL